MDKVFEVTINNKIIKLKGYFVGDYYCVDSLSIDSHPFLSLSEKESLKRRLTYDKNIILD